MCSLILFSAGDVLQRLVGDFYHATLLPGLLLVVLYIIYCLAFCVAEKRCRTSDARNDAPRALQYWQVF
jgi:TRAP-type mannitol/chloroaromatic compound transport system permease large subunit